VLKFLTAGNCGKDTLDSLKILKERGQDGMEVEFVRQIYMKNDMAKKVGELANRLGLMLTVHAPYYINLTSNDKIKVKASIKRILDSCERGHHMGARSVTFHAAYYGKNNPDKEFELVKNQIIKMMKIIKERNWSVELSPETTGKISQFGSLDELIKLKKQTGCGICVDFAHVLAREGRRDYDEILNKLRKARINNVHCHFSGISYGPKGEKNHLISKEKDIKELIKALLQYKINAYIVNESPDPLGDTIKSKKIYLMMNK